jgi:cytochrome c oxidase subunit 3
MTTTRPPPLLPSAVLGTLMFVIIEAMMFAGMISAVLIIQTSGIWPPPDQPRLPVEETAVNTAALMLSGVLLYVASRAYSRERAAARTPLVLSILLGAFFVIFQGVEWVALVDEGLTLTSSTLGSFFYLIVGMHALHAIVALGFLVWALVLLQRRRLNRSTFAAAQVFWYFVVGLWPILYWQVYL